MERCSNEDFLVKEIKPSLGGAVDLGSAEVYGNHKLISSYDLVEPMHYLYIRIVKAKDLPVKEFSADTSSLSNDVTDSSCDPYAVVKVGNYKHMTKYFKNTSTPNWNQVIGILKCRIYDSEVDVRIMDNRSLIDPFMGRVLFELEKVPKIVPPQTPPSPRWYRLEDRKGDRVDGEVMLAIWFGTQADEAFSEGWFSNANRAFSKANLRSKIYFSPKLWYLRVNAIEAQDLVLSKMRNSPEIFVKATVGIQALETKVSTNKSINPFWNEDLIFVVAEPFEEPLVLNVIERFESNKEECLGRCVIHLKHAEKSLNHRDVITKWSKLETDNLVEEGNNEVNFASRIHTRICLESGYHVKDESDHNSSDFQPADEQLWKSRIGVLEVGILRAQGLSQMMKIKRGRATTDAYCVAKYGKEWARTRTICDSLFPKWNEQYAWKVFDPCTVLTIGVFDNCHFLGGGKDSIIGKVRIRVSTLESGRVYTHSYPLLVLTASGLKKTGEIHLAVRFAYDSMFSMIKIYSQPLLPEKHYSHPLAPNKLDTLRWHASQLISNELSLAEPPLKKEVLNWMLEVDSNMMNILTMNSNVWSWRKSKANFFRLMAVLNVFYVVWKWFNEIRNWKNPTMTILIHILVIFLVWCPKLILPSIFLYYFLGRVWYYRWRPTHPPHLNAFISCVNGMHPDELDEEFDTYPTSRPFDTVKRRYDRLRTINGRMQTGVGDLSSQGERIQSLLKWRDPRPTTFFTIFCLAAAIFLYITPFQAVALLTGLYILRHPIFRSKQPSMLLNCFKRLPAGSDCML